MKKISRSIVIVPSCHNLDSFPTHFTGDAAASILANWTSAWHPSLISSSGQRPYWCSTDQTSMIDNGHTIDSAIDVNEPTEFNTDSEFDFHHDDQEIFPHDDGSDHDEGDPDDGGPLTLSALSRIEQKRNGNAGVVTSDEDRNDAPISLWRDAVIFIPTVCNDRLADGFAASAAHQSAVLIAGETERPPIFDRLTTVLSMPTATGHGASLADDFCALGYAWLQIQLLTRKIRYSSNLDQAKFDSFLIAAAKAFTDHDLETAEIKLTACYDLLMEEKNNYYPVKPDLIDLVLTAPTTLGKSLTRELAKNHVSNLYITGADVDRISKSQPETITKIKQRLQENTCDIVGGSHMELPDPLLSKESMLNQVMAGQSIAQKHFNRVSSVYLRRKGGLTSDLPGVLDAMDFQGALHCALDGATIPRGSSGTIQWSGPGDASVMAKTETPIDAAEPGVFLDFAVQFGRQIDSAHSATMILTHWPDRTCEAFRDLVRISRRSPLLGEFQTLTQHFDEVYDPGYGDRYLADEYRAGFLRDAMASESDRPVSSIIQYWKHFFHLSALQHLHTMVCLFARLKSSELVDADTIQASLLEIQNAIESPTANWGSPQQETSAKLQRLEETLKQHMKTLLIGQQDLTADSNKQTVLLNPLSFTRRTLAIASTTSSSESANRSEVATSKAPFQMVAPVDEKNKHAVMSDVASQSFRVLSPRPDATKTTIAATPDLQKDNRLRNEFFEATIDEVSGGLRSIHFHGKRGNLVGQRLIFRDASKRSVISKMVCDSIDYANVSKITGQITTRGRIEESGTVVANFIQTFRLSRGQRILEIDIQIDPKVQLPNSETTCFASQIAWQDEACVLNSGVQMVRHEINAPKIESPNFVEIATTDYRLTLCAGGLPWHKRTERCKLESILVVGREQQRSFRIGIGIDVPYPTRAAIDFDTPVFTLPEVPSQSFTNPLPQLFHLDCKNIVATSSLPLTEGNRCVGFVLRLQETEGRSGTLNITTPFPIASSYHQDFRGENIEALIDDADVGKRGPVTIAFAQHEYFQVEIRFDDDC